MSEPDIKDCKFHLSYEQLHFIEQQKEQFSMQTKSTYIRQCIARMLWLGQNCKLDDHITLFDKEHNKKLQEFLLSDLTTRSLPAAPSRHAVHVYVLADTSEHMFEQLSFWRVDSRAAFIEKSIRISQQLYAYGAYNIDMSITDSSGAIKWRALPLMAF